MHRRSGAGHGGLHCDLDRAAVIFRLITRRTAATATTILPMSKEDARFWALLRDRRNTLSNGKDAA